MSNAYAHPFPLAHALPTLSRDEMEQQNRIARWRAPLTLPGAEAFSLQRLEQTTQHDSIADRLIIDLTLGGDPLTATLPRGLVLDLLRSLQNSLSLDPLPPPDLTALLLEAALLPLIEVFERRAGSAIGLHGVAEMPRTPTPLSPDASAHIRTTFLLRGPGISQTLSVQAPVQTMDQLLRNWGAGKRKLDLLPVPLTLHAGSTILSARLVRSLRIGDAVLLQDVAAASLREGLPSLMRLVVADRLVATLRCTQTGLHLETALRQTWKAGQMADDNSVENLPGPEPVVDLDELPVRLVFEADRLELPLGEVRRLGVGSILEMGTRPGQVRILVNGRRIGDGELVSIDNRAGVRITALMTDPDSDAARNVDGDVGGDSGT